MIPILAELPDAWPPTNNDIINVNIVHRYIALTSELQNLFREKNLELSPRVMFITINLWRIISFSFFNNRGLRISLIIVG